ncbi:4-hydroxy-3-methylbut-2-enyl diphosphate reductase [Cellulosilyticum sp. I15G10I2]|uniref:4-hydroxy-3-methylbut-2-enyl diphosphate reductase n=1 Tax=Cellulosilyticum sp. I15G10I2 TaxID=1892843 RepID=UPI00085C3880|nr:4-hydroxy-3-methylbut-2-enyl diphosphate reductase [Cellulosilyticum sp. I15G10I2]
MNIILAKTAGFCFGVKRAVDMAYKYQNTLNTYTFGPIIHNDVVINNLIEKGISPINQLEDKEVDTLIIRSHGVTPKVYQSAKEKNITLVDATCPYVKKIHRLVEEYFLKGYEIIIIGNKTHPEVEGINGWAHNKCFIVKDLADLIDLNLNKKVSKYLLVAQTTYKKEVVTPIIQYLEAEGYQHKYINTICNATKARQEEAVNIAQKAECMLVIGSPYSSNTLKLYEICKQYCEDSYCIAQAHELTHEMIYNCNVVGITAGASTPASVIEEVIQKLHQMNT